jgi:hypothetical protein
MSLQLWWDIGVCLWIVFVTAWIVLVTWRLRR